MGNNALSSLDEVTPAWVASHAAELAGALASLDQTSNVIRDSLARVRALETLFPSASPASSGPSKHCVVKKASKK